MKDKRPDLVRPERASAEGAAAKGEARQPRPGRATHDDNWIQARWLAPILDLPELRQQVRRGRVLARKAVKELKIRAGLMSAEVASDSGETHSVKVRMDPIDGPTWVAVIEAISDEAALAADLIRGRLSERLAEIFEDAGHDLFPFDLRDVSSYCSCREDAKVCTGAVATHIHFAEVIQADPMKLLSFRGRDKSWLEDEVRERRGGAPAPSRSSARPTSSAARSDGGAPKTSRSTRPGDRGGEANEPAIALKDGFWIKSELPNLTFHLEKERLTEDEAFPIVRALGPGPGETPPEEVAAALYPVLRTARLKLDHIQNRVEHESETPPPEVEAVPEPEPLDEMLMSAAIRQGQLTTTMVAQALGVSAREAREYLQFLVTAGRLAIVGKARGTRYVPIVGGVPIELGSESVVVVLAAGEVAPESPAVSDAEAPGVAKALPVTTPLGEPEP